MRALDKVAKGLRLGDAEMAIAALLKLSPTRCSKPVPKPDAVAWSASHPGTISRWPT